VIVGADEFVVGARAAEQLKGAVGNHLVGIHVVRRPRTGLKRIHDELVIILAFHHLLRCADDRTGDERVEQA
jgi:hypothetical protein